MNNDIYAVVKRYEIDGKEFNEWMYKPQKEYCSIYDKMMELTDNDHEISAGAASWCELASVGEKYEFHEGEIEMMEID